MSNSFESRKPRAEAKVRDLAQENERLQRALREEQARHDAKVADVKAMEKRIGELRRELDTAAALHREVKARLESNSEYDRNVSAAAQEENARLATENTRLQGDLQNERDENGRLFTERAAFREENTRLRGAVESAVGVLRDCAQALSAEANNYLDNDGKVQPHAKSLWRLDKQARNAAEALEQAAPDKQLLRQPSPEGTIDGGYDAGPQRDDR